MDDEELARNMVDYYNTYESNPFYPVPIDDYPKLRKLVITTRGLVYFNELKRRFTMGEKLSFDELYALQRLWLYYGLTNKNPQAQHDWFDFILRINKENPEFSKFQPKQNLTKLGYLMKNENYDPNLIVMHEEWQEKSLVNVRKKNQERFNIEDD
ncbi:MAG TPA: hypothetical protein VLD38_07055 [Nitrosopumilaceae archaeon]|nr:hypothetical protein [Nitrosopumilaceae archaeon]